MAEHLTDEQISEMRDAFALFDKDGNGDITVDELGVVMRSLGLQPTDTELADMINEVDTDQSGKIEFNEFIVMMTTKMKKTTDYEAELRQAFKVFDRDNSGTISPDELRHVLESIGDRVTGQELDEMMKEADLDRNGSIDYKEFAQLMARK